MIALPLLLPPQDFFMRLLRQPRNLFRSGLCLIRTFLTRIVMMLMHFALVLMKIELIYSCCSDLERFDVSCLIFHKTSYIVAQTLICEFVFQTNNHRLKSM